MRGIVIQAISLNAKAIRNGGKVNTVISVKFNGNNKAYYFDPKGIDFAVGDSVIVETVRGIEFGQVVKANHEIKEFIKELKPVQRRATQADIERHAENAEKGVYALNVAQEKVRQHGLEMKLVSAEYTFDRSKVIISFTADGRIDFRELVRDLAGVLRLRIELKQIYDRDDIVMRGALAQCGRPCCCKEFLQDFEKVSIKMAKNQNLSLNPQKISGMCGKLMCCLKYENEYYADINKRMPKRGAIVLTPDGKGEVDGMDVLQCNVSVKVAQPDDTIVLKTYSLDDIKPITKGTLADTVKDDDVPAELKLLED